MLLTLNFDPRYPSLMLLLTKKSTSIRSSLESFWSKFKEGTTFGKDFSPFNDCKGMHHWNSFESPQFNYTGTVKEGDEFCCNFNKNLAKKLQKQTVLLFQDYSFAEEAWGLLIGIFLQITMLYNAIIYYHVSSVPQWLEIPKIGKISVKNLGSTKNRTYLPMLSPVLVGSKVFVDSDVVIVGFDAAPAMKKIPMTGIRTVKSDFYATNNKFLSFELSGEGTILICWDVETLPSYYSGLKVRPTLHAFPSWVAKRGYKITSMSVRTSSSIHIVLAKHFSAPVKANGICKVTLGGCHGDKQRHDMSNYFILVCQSLSLEDGSLWTSQNLSESPLNYSAMSSNFDTPFMTPLRNFDVSRNVEFVDSVRKIDFPWTPSTTDDNLNSIDYIDGASGRRYEMMMDTINLKDFRWHLSLEDSVNDEDVIKLKKNEKNNHDEKFQNGTAQSQTLFDEFSIRGGANVSELSLQKIRAISVCCSVAAIKMLTSCESAENGANEQDRRDFFVADVGFHLRDFRSKVTMQIGHCAVNAANGEGVSREIFPFDCFDQCTIDSVGSFDLQIAPSWSRTNNCNPFNARNPKVFSNTRTEQAAVSTAHAIEPSVYSLNCRKMCGTSSMTVSLLFNRAIVLNISPSMLNACKEVYQGLVYDAFSPPTSHPIGYAGPSPRHSGMLGNKKWHCKSDLQRKSEYVSATSSSGEPNKDSILSTGLPFSLGDRAMKKLTPIPCTQPAVEAVVVKNLLGQDIHLEIKSESGDEGDNSTTKWNSLQFYASGFQRRDSKNADNVRYDGNHTNCKCFCKLPANCDARVHKSESGGIDIASLTVSIDAPGWSSVRNIKIPLPSMAQDASGLTVWTDSDILCQIHKTQLPYPRRNVSFNTTKALNCKNNMSDEHSFSIREFSSFSDDHGEDDDLEEDDDSMEEGGGGTWTDSSNYVEVSNAVADRDEDRDDEVDSVFDGNNDSEEDALSDILEFYNSDEEFVEEEENFLESHDMGHSRNKKGVTMTDMFVDPFKDLDLKGSVRSKHDEQMKGLDEYSSSDKHCRSHRFTNNIATSRSPFALHLVGSMRPLQRHDVDNTTMDDPKVLNMHLSESCYAGRGSASKNCVSGHDLNTRDRWILEITVSTNVSLLNSTEGAVAITSPNSKRKWKNDCVTHPTYAPPGDEVKLSLSALRKSEFQIQKTDMRSFHRFVDESATSTFLPHEKISIMQRFLNPSIPSRLRTSHDYNFRSLSIEHFQHYQNGTMNSGPSTDNERADGDKNMLHWRLILNSALVFVNGLPCKVRLQVMQTSDSGIAADLAECDGTEQGGAHSLLFMSGGYSDFDGTNPSLSNDKVQESGPGVDMMNPFNLFEAQFENDKDSGRSNSTDWCVSRILQPGQSFSCCSLRLERHVFFRVSLVGRHKDIIMWSKPRYVCPPSLYRKRSLFQKHNGEELHWEYFCHQDLSKMRAPQGIKFQRVWKKHREVVIYSDFWLINKTGMALEYQTELGKMTTSQDNQRMAIDLSSCINSHAPHFNRNPLPECKSTFSDELHAAVFNPAEVPLLLSCPKRLRILPHSLHTPKTDMRDQNELYIYDFNCLSGRSYNIMTKVNRSPCFDLGRWVSILSECPVYSDEDWLFSFSSWPPSLQSLLVVGRSKTGSSSDHNTKHNESLQGLFIQPPNSDRYSTPHHRREEASRLLSSQSLKESASNPNSRLSSFITFKISASSFVYVGMDARRAIPPPWLCQLGFISTGERIYSNNVSTVYYLYRKFYRAGDPVCLGGNKGKASADSIGRGSTVNMYLIFVLLSPPEHQEPTVGAVMRHPSPRTLWTSSIHIMSSLVKNTVAAVTRRSRRSTRTCQLKSHFRIGDCVFSEDQLRVNSLANMNEHNHVDSSIEVVTVVELPKVLRKIPLLALQTNKADRFISSQHRRHLELELRHPTRVFLCVDKRLDQLPSWVSEFGFTDSTLHVHTSLSRKANADVNEGVFRIYHRVYGTEVCTFGGLGVNNSSICNYFVLLADEETFSEELSFFPVNTIPGCRRSTSDLCRQVHGEEAKFISENDDSVLSQKIPSSILDFWEYSKDSALSTEKPLAIQRPLLSQQGRQWSEYFDARNKGEIMMSSVSLSLAPVTPLPGIFHRSAIFLIIHTIIICALAFF